MTGIIRLALLAFILLPSTALSLTSLGNGTATDITGLMWQVGETEFMNWQGALTYCNQLALANHTDWRLPNIKELESIVDPTKYDPATDTTVFPQSFRQTYWSSTTSEATPYVAFSLFIKDGTIEEKRYGSGINPGEIKLDTKTTDLMNVKCVRTNK